MICSCLALLLLPACVTLRDPESSQEYRAEVVGRVEPGQEIGQTFVSRRSRLDEVQLWLRLASAPPAAGEVLRIELYRLPDRSRPVATFPLGYETISRSFPVMLRIGPFADPPGQEYYLALKTEGGPVEVFGRAEDAYPHGTAALNGAPLQADLAFRLGYDLDARAVLADLGAWLGQAWLVVPLALVLWLPGRWFAALLGLGEDLDLGGRLGLSVGLSLALIPVVLLWTTTLGLRGSPAAAWGGAGALAAWLAWIELSHGRIHKPRLNWRRLWSLDALLVGVLLFSWAVRLLMVRDLAAPAWVDSVHHALITRLITEQGAFPASYAPYIEIHTASYHAGFHASAAVFQWFSGLDVAQALLVFGQALNALAVIAAYLFTLTLTQNRLAGVIAGFITGLLSPMPAYYTSWGRYTQLAGLLILPAAFYLLGGLGREPPAEAEAPERRAAKPKWRAALAAALACGGLFLVHYRVIVFLAALLVVYFPVQVRWARRGPNRREWIRAGGRILLAAGLAIVLTLPWWPETLRTLFLPRIAVSQVKVAWFSDFSWRLVTAAYGRQALALGAIGLAWSLVRRPSLALGLALWTALLFCLANLGALGLPGTGLINNLSVEIALFLPVAVLGGFWLAEVLQAAARLLPAGPAVVFKLACLAAGATLALTASRALLPILNPTTLLFRQPDRPALAWIEKNIPPGATVLINPFSWGYGLYGGNDGGYWISPLAGRKTMPPPALYGLEDFTAESQAISDFSRAALDSAGDPEALFQLMQGRGIEYLYTGGRGGAFSPQALLSSPRFRPLYTQNGTWVFQIRPKSSGSPLVKSNDNVTEGGSFSR